METIGKPVDDKPKPNRRCLNTKPKLSGGLIHISKVTLNPQALNFSHAHTRQPDEQVKAHPTLNLNSEPYQY